MISVCDRCGGPLTDGYEIREYGQHENGYVDEEILCAECIEEEKPQTVLTLDADSRLTDIPNSLAFFRYPERVQIGNVRLV